MTVEDRQGGDPVRDPGYPYGEFDAMKWAEEFDRIFPDRRPDTATMLGWFANAIMTGYDKAKNEAALRAAADSRPAELDDTLELALRDWMTATGDDRQSEDDLRDAAEPWLEAHTRWRLAATEADQ